MPYTSVGKCVYKKAQDGKRGEKVGCTKGDIKSYLQALYATSKDEARLATREIKESLKEGGDNFSTDAFGVDDQLGKFFIVQKPSKESTTETIVTEGDLFTLANLFKRGLDFDNVFGLYKTFERAQKIGGKLIQEMRKQMKENLKLGENKVGEIETEIQDIKLEIESHMDAAMMEPGTRDSHFASAEKLLGDLKTKEKELNDLRGALETEGKKLEEAEKTN
jgi:hypothetical protein